MLKNRIQFSTLNSYAHIFFLFLIFIFYIAAIMSGSYIKDVYATGDACNYLREAEALLHGYGFNSDGMAGGSHWFAAWPIGYPALIALVALIIKSSNIYLCSKFLSICLIGTILGYFAYKFKEKSWLYALVLLNKGIVVIYQFPWSETAFFLTLILYCTIISQIVTESNPQKRYYLFLFICCYSAFLFRYFGIMLLLFNGIICLVMTISFFVHKRNDSFLKKRIISLIITCFCIVFCEIAYLYTNYIMNGLSTGVERTYFVDDRRELLKQLFSALKAEFLNVISPENSVLFTHRLQKAFFIVLIFILLFMIIKNTVVKKKYNIALVVGLGVCIGTGLYTMYKCNKPAIMWQMLASVYQSTMHNAILSFALLGVLLIILVRRKKIDEASIFVLVGVFYYITFIIIRFHSTMDNFGFRFFAPASALILIGLISIFVERINFDNALGIEYAIGILVLLGTLTIIKSGFKYEKTDWAYYKTKSEIQENLAVIPSKSIILHYTGNENAYYLRPDIVFSGRIDCTDGIDNIVDRYQEYAAVFISKDVASEIIKSGDYTVQLKKYLQMLFDSQNTKSDYLKIY